MVGYCHVCKIGLGEEENVSIHKLPKDEETKANWFAFIGYETGPHSGICSKHFKESDFIYKIYGDHIRRFLKPGACPSKLQYRLKDKKNTTTVHKQSTNNCTSSGDYDTNDCTSSGNQDTNDCTSNVDHDTIDYTSIRDHDTNDCTSNEDYDKDDKNDIILNSSIKSEDVSFEFIKIESDITEEISPMVKIPSNSKTDNSLTGKRRCNIPRYVGDIRSEDFNSYECWAVFNKYFTETKKKLKYLTNENTRLSNKVTKLQAMIDHFKEKGFICSDDRNCLTSKMKKRSFTKM